MKVAASVWVHRMEEGKCLEDEAPVRLLSLFTSARQDSGSLADFKQVHAVARAHALTHHLTAAFRSLRSTRACR